MRGYACRYFDERVKIGSFIIEYVSDYFFHMQEQEIGYPCECGTFSDYTNLRSVTVSEEQRIAINAMQGVM